MVWCNSFSVFAFAFTPFSFAHSRLYSLILLLLSHPSLSQLSSSRPFFLIPSSAFLSSSLPSPPATAVSLASSLLLFPKLLPPCAPCWSGGGGAPKGTIRRRRARLGGPRDRSWRFPLVNSAEYGPLPRRPCEEGSRARLFTFACMTGGLKHGTRPRLATADLAPWL